MNSEYKLLLSPINIDAAQESVKSTLQQAKRSLGFLPNMYRNMANSPALLKAYLFSYDVVRNETVFNAMEQEVIFLAISKENHCEYCVSAHSFIADKMSGVPTEITDAIRNGTALANKKLAELYAFTLVMHETRGLPEKKDVSRFVDSGYSERHILDLIVLIAVKTMSNYANHLFHTPLDNIFTERKWQV